MGTPRKHLERVPGVRIWKRRGEGLGAKFKLTYRDPDSGRDRTESGSTDRDRGACADCGAAEDVHAHHADYSKPLDVTWLCRDCHWTRHTKSTATAVAERRRS